MKDAVCEAAGFHLLRIDSRPLDRGPRGRRLVEYLIDAREYLRAFEEARERGYVPADEIGDYRLVVDQEGFVNDLAGPARLHAFQAFRAGSCPGLLTARRSRFAGMTWPGWHRRLVRWHWTYPHRGGR